MTLSLAKLILIFSIIGAIVSLIKICFNAVNFARAIKEKETKNIKPIFKFNNNMLVCY